MVFFMVFFAGANLVRQVVLRRSILALDQAAYWSHASFFHHNGKSFNGKRSQLDISELC